MGMGWNLLGGALAGLGNGMVQNADAEQKRVAAEALAMKEQALARLNSDLSMQRNEADYKMKAPEREFSQGLSLRGMDNTERATTANIDNMQQTRDISRDQLAETAQHNRKTEQIAADKTEANITIASMRAESGRMAAELRALEKQAQLPKEQIEYLKGFSSSRTKILSDTTLPEADKKSALAALDADLYANYPPKILRDRETGAYQTQDVLGRTRNFKNADELKAAGFPSVSGSSAGGSPPPIPAPAAKKGGIENQDAWTAELNKMTDERLKEIARGNDAGLASIAKKIIESRSYTPSGGFNLMEQTTGAGNYGAYGVFP